MFVGHYAASFAAKSVRSDLPLWLLIVAVQFVDYIWAILLILGVEKARFVPGFTEASSLDLYYMPYSHSLLAGVVWSIVFAGVYLLLRGSRLTKQQRLVHGIVLAAAVFSHWLTDLIVHVEDLPLLHGDPKFGFGLWRDFWLSQGLEFGLLAAGFAWYMIKSSARNIWGYVLPVLLIAVFFLLQAYSHHAPPPPNMTAFAVQALVAYSLFALLAFYVERFRPMKP